jgi:hypothetical protein
MPSLQKRRKITTLSSRLNIQASELILRFFQSFLKNLQANPRRELDLGFSSRKISQRHMAAGYGLKIILME